MAFHDTQLLKSLPLFHHLSATELAQVSSTLQVRSYPAGREILKLGQPGREVQIVLSGAVKVFIRRPTGHHLLLAILGRSEVLGELSALDHQPHSAGIVTLNATCCLTLEAEVFRGLVQSLPTLNFNLVQMLARRLRRVTQQAEALATLDVTGRVARQLMLLSQEYGCPTDSGLLIPLRVTQSDLASLVGASREKVNRVLRRFTAQGYIAFNVDQQILIQNGKALTNLCH